jgi:hypothetical protein
VTCYLLTRRIIHGLRILYLDLLDVHQAELQSLITFPITSHKSVTSSGSSFVLNWRKLFLMSFRDELLCRTAMANSCGELLRNLSLSLNLSLILRPTVSRQVCLGIKHPSGAYDQIFICLWQLRPCFCGRPLGPSPFRLVTIFYCLWFETSLFVASYDLHGGGIRPRLHTGLLRNQSLTAFIISAINCWSVRCHDICVLTDRYLVATIPHCSGCRGYLAYRTVESNLVASVDTQFAWIMYPSRGNGYLPP